MYRSLARRLATAAVVALVAVAGTATPALAEASGVLTGRLTLADGSPAVAATVEVTDQFSSPAIRSTTTDHNGVYRLGELGGRYRLQFRAAGSAVWQYSPRQQVWFRGQVIDVADGSTVTIDETLVATGTLTGQITGPNGPANNLMITVSDGTGTAGVTYTDNAGTFTFHLLVGAYRVTIHRSGMRQYIPGKIAESEADFYTVTAGGTTVANDTLLPTGSISGVLLDSDGTPEAGAWVNATSMNGSASTQTGADGRYVLQDLFADDYRVQFMAGSRAQYAHQATWESARQVRVVANTDTVVDETLFALGTVEVTATDATTGAPVQRFCVDASSPTGSWQNGCTETGTATLSLPATVFSLSISPQDDTHMGAEKHGVHVAGNATTKITVSLQLSAIITTTVVDAVTGAPLQDVCVYPYTLRFGGVGDLAGWCSDEQGKVRMGPVVGDKYTLLAFMYQGEYGAQWVGPHGGTGSQYKARLVEANPGQVTEVPPIKMDKTGTVTGVITDEATGAPLHGACAAYLPFFSSGSGAGPTGGCTDSNGRYEFTGLGPYEWPIEFIARDGYAWEWSGNATNRLLATPVKVTAGQTATANAALAKGTKITGKISDADGQPLPSNSVVALNVLTGDCAGQHQQEQLTYTLSVHGNQFVHLRVSGYSEQRGPYAFWYNRATKVERATPVFVPASGTKTVHLLAPPS